MKVFYNDLKILNYISFLKLIRIFRMLFTEKYLRTEIIIIVETCKTIVDIADFLFIILIIIYT